MAEETGVQTYYASAPTALRYLEHRAPNGRRFRQDSDLCWTSFRGHVQDVDRIDLPHRDADVQWASSIGAGFVNRYGFAEHDSNRKEWAPLELGGIRSVARATPIGRGESRYSISRSRQSGSFRLEPHGCQAGASATEQRSCPGLRNVS